MSTADATVDAMAATPTQPAATGATPTGRARRRRDPEIYVHLVWLAFLVFQPVFDPTSGARDWWAVAAMVAFFLPVYFWTWSRSGRAAVPGIAVLAAMGAVLPAVNSGASGFLIYAAAAAGLKLPARAGLLSIAGLMALAVVSAALSPIPWPVVLAVYTPPLLMVPLIGGLNVYYGIQARANRRLHRAHDEIERLAAIAERERIARDLHDLLGHTLSVIVLKSELAAKLADHDATRATNEIRDVERISRRALGEVREAVARYRQRGLAAELEEARAAFDAASVRLGFALPDAPPPPRVEGVLAMVAREALTNVLRHARASRCDVRLDHDGGAWVLEVRDDGHGRLGPAGNGLAGVRERIEALGGRVDVSGGAGVRLVARLPGAAA